MNQQSRILAGVFCSGMAAALIAMAALQLPNWLQQRKMVSESPPVVQTTEPEQTPETQVTAAPNRAARRYPGTAGFYRTAGA